MDGLTVRGLTRRFGGIIVLDAVSFDVPPGSAVAIIGPNGSGKTTLLRCVIGADLPDEGEVLLAGQPMDETDPAMRAATASALDDFDFFPDLSVREHLELLAFAHGAATDVVPEVIAAFGLGPAHDQLPPTLSTGQRQRLALASCFVRPRRMLVLDEPEQRLECAGRAWLIRRLLDEKAAGTGIVFASHDAELVRAVADAHVELAS